MNLARSSLSVVAAVVASVSTSADASSIKAASCETAQIPAHTTGTIAQSLGTAVAAAKYEDLTPEVIDRVKLTILDNLATLAYTTELTRNDPYMVRARMRGGVQEATFWGRSARQPVEDAAAVNAWLIHAAETDDSDFRASLRASPVVMGPALAMAEAQRSTGREFLLSLAAGYTVLGRLAAPLGPLQLKGSMSSGVWGPPAAATVAAKLLQMDAGSTANAIAIAGAASGGSFQYFFDQTEEKRLIVARAARSGVEAAMLACRGEKGATRIFEGAAGLYRIYGGERAGDIDAAVITQHFDRLEGPMRLYPKFFAASASIIPFLEALAPIRASIDAAQIDHFIVRGNGDAANIYKAKLDQYAAPPTVIGAKTSLPFVLALYLTRGTADPFTFTPEALADPTINALAARGRFELRQVPTELSIKMKDGTVRTVVPIQSDGTRDEPIARELRMEKFQSLTRDLPERARLRLLAEVQAIENEQDMRAWAQRINRLLSH